MIIDFNIEVTNTEMDYFMHLLFNEVFGFKFENEFETMQIHLRKHFSNARREMVIERVTNLATKDSPANLSIKSEKLRKQGNKLFKASTKNALAAARWYTKAIFAAPLGSEALAMAHANRALALQQFGYFSQAYDDCICALEQGYPMNMRHKLIMRQGYCALNLGDVTLLTQHLETLNAMPPNKNFVVGVHSLQKGLDELQLKQQKSEGPEQQQIALYRDKIKILKSPAEGRFMVATKPIEKNELIFSDRATSFIPFGEWRICQQCAATQLIPFPCYLCSGKVVYCSVNCRKAHETTHKYECIAYEMDLFPKESEIQLGFRMVLDGIKQVIPFLRDKHTAKEIWHELTDEDSELLQNGQLEYVQVLRRVTHLDKNPAHMITAAARASVVLLAYLTTYTNFFNIHFKDTHVSHSDWELIIGSLILRHSGQSRAHINQTGYIIRSPQNADPLDFELMDNNLWDRPLHVRRGFLHQKIRIVAQAFTASYPYLGLMNHSCESSVKLKLTGRYLSALAINNINSSEQIFLNYAKCVSDATKELRSCFLQNFDFECNCSKCKRDDQYENNKFHRYRCENSKCRMIFTPTSESLYWWIEPDDGNRLRCTKCNTLQRNLLACISQINGLRKSLERCTSRNKVLKMCKDLDRWLLDNHKLKFIRFHDVVVDCLSAHIGGSTLSKKDFIIVNKICQAMFDFANEFKVIEIYAWSISCLWDLVALGKHKCNPEEMQHMLEVIETVSDEIKTILINYYNDFISTTIAHS